MTKKDYIKFAEMFKTAKPYVGDSTGHAGERRVTDEVWRHAARRAADIFAQDNDRFDRERFLVACGLA